MNPRSLVLVVVAIAIAGVAAYLARSMMQEAPAQAEIIQVAADANTVNILVAAQEMPVGTIVNQDHVRWQAWPEDAVDQRYLQQDGIDLNEAVFTRVARASLTQGEPVMSNKLVGPGERGFLAAILAPGNRAITVPITQTSGIAGFIFPGDRVDMILTHQVTDVRQKIQQISETVLTNLRVLAIDQRTNDQENEPIPGSTVTLEVSPKFAEMVALVVQMGELSLALRALPDQADNGGEPAVNPEFLDTARTFTQGSDLSALLPKVDAQGDASFISVARGADNDKIDVGGL